jgi:dienelactone hydrolase
MSDRDLSKRDALEDFQSRQITLLGKKKRVFVSGSGPAVIVMTEMPWISPQVARFARWTRDAGFTVYMPDLFGDAGAPVAGAGLKMMSTMIGTCIAGQFHAFRSNSSGPIAQWLRALARLAHEEAGGKGVGAIGMCFTGNFALTMMLEPSMLAPVLSQPSLPMNNPAGMHIAPDELAAVKARMDRENLTVKAYRFEGDSFCRAERFAAYQQALGDRFEGVVLKDSDANPNAALKMPHSVVTQHLIDEEGQPTRKARDDILAFFKMRLQ